MLDAAQARVVAYIDPDGNILSADTAESLYGDAVRAGIETDKIREPGGWSFSVVDALDAIGLRPLSRFDVDEINSARGLDDDDVTEDTDTYALVDDTTGEVI